MQGCSKQNTNGHISKGTEGNQGLNKVSEISIKTPITPVRLKGTLNSHSLIFPSLVKQSSVQGEGRGGRSPGFGVVNAGTGWQELRHGRSRHRSNTVGMLQRGLSLTF